MTSIGKLCLVLKFKGILTDEETKMIVDIKDTIMNEIMDNIGNYIDIELEEIEESELNEDG